jgi:hypothetical protein
MFDHSKAAIVDEIVRQGLPPGNPFLAGAGPRLVYYYLWHFSAALPAVLVGASGWEAEIALTWVTTLASLGLVIGLAADLGRRWAVWLVPLFALAGSARPLWDRLADTAGFERLLSAGPWPEGWLFQASWAPQHLAAANCVVLAAWLLPRLAAPASSPLVPLIGALAAAGFESSAWIGGIVFGAAAPAIGAVLLLAGQGLRARLALACRALLAALAATLIAVPFLRDEFLATAARQAGPPLALRPFAVLGAAVPAAIRHLLDLGAYWAILLPLQLPAIFVAGVLAAVMTLRGPPRTRLGHQQACALALLAATSFAIPWLFASTIANNDLAWRGVLPGVLILIVFAAAGLSQWLAAKPRQWRATVAAGLWLLGLPGGFEVARANIRGLTASSAAAFAKAPELWAAVRRHTAPDERVANNPADLADEVRWPVNIGWALLANRRSCFAGWNLARAFAPWPEAKIDRANALFERVFAGAGTADDIGSLATRFDCRVVVVTRRDGAWRRDPFAASPEFRLVEERTGRWRIYRRIDHPRRRQ